MFKKMKYVIIFKHILLCVIKSRLRILTYFRDQPFNKIEAKKKIILLESLGHFLLFQIRNILKIIFNIGKKYEKYDTDL